MTNFKADAHHNDVVLALAEYWLNADLMHDYVHSLRDTYEGDLQGVSDAGEFITFRTVLSFWLSALFVVCEGFKELKLNDDRLEALIDAHYADLKLFRNGTFHFQRKPFKQTQLFDGTANRLNWAEELHDKFEDFFASYIDELEERRITYLKD